MGEMVAAPDVATMGDLADWFLPANLAKRAGQVVEQKINDQRSAIVGGLSRSIQASGSGAARAVGPYLLGAAAIVALGIVGFAYVGKKGKAKR